MSKQDKATPEVKQNFFAIFLLFFPTVIIAAIPSTLGGIIILPFALKTLLAFYQFVVVKNFVDKYYGN